MRLVSVKNIKPEVSLAKNIYDSYGRVLLKKGTNLSNGYIRKLHQLNIKSVYIEDGSLSSFEVEEVVSEETRSEVFEIAREALLNTRVGSEIQKQKVKAAVDKLIAEILLDRDVIIYLNDIRVIQDHTFCHSVNVCILSLIVGLSMGYSQWKLQQLGIGALLHDVGKARMLDLVNSEKKLTEQCYEYVQKHCDLGFEALKASNIGILAAHVALEHHERYNGKGYPRRLKGKGIKESARIVAIADVYDALTSDRPYRDRMLPHEAMKLIRSAAGIDFDPDIVETFSSKIAPYPVGSPVILNTGYEGIVTMIKTKNT